MKASGLIALAALATTGCFVPASYAGNGLVAKTCVVCSTASL